MAWRRLDYCLYHRRVQIALDLQYCPYLRAHLYAHRSEFVSWLCLFSCLSASVPSNYCHAPAGETLHCPLTGLNLGVSAFAFIKPPLGYPDFFQTALVCDSMLIVVLNYICDFFLCKHFFAWRYFAWNKFAIRTSPVYRHKILPKSMPIQHNIPPLKPIDEYPDFWLKHLHI